MKHIIPNIRHFNQLDLPNGSSKCWTSTVYSLLSQHEPSLTAPQYDNIRSSYGRSIYAASHVSACKELGYELRFTTNATISQTMGLITSDIPVGVGWLHHDHVSNPNGFGHWSCIYGVDDLGWYVRDPMGDPDLVNGGWLSYDTGYSLHYSFKNFNPRWQHPADGYGYACWIA